MKKLFPIFIFIASSLSVAQSLVTDNVNWLYSKKEERLAALRDAKHPKNLEASNVVLATWEMADGAINGDVAPFLAEMWISRTEDVLYYFQNKEQDFNRWASKDFQESMLFYDHSGKDLADLVALHSRLIKHLEAHKSPLGDWRGTKFQNAYLKTLKMIDVNELNR